MSQCHGPQEGSMDHASSVGPPSSSAGTGSGSVLRFLAPLGRSRTGAEVAGGARLAEVGAMCGCRGRLAVHRSVHDLASWQYQRMSAQAWPPSGTIRPVGRAIPHSEHWAEGKGWWRSSRCVAIDESPQANGRLIGLPLAVRAAPATVSASPVRRMRPFFPPQGHQPLRPSFPQDEGRCRRAASLPKLAT